MDYHITMPHIILGIMIGIVLGKAVIAMEQEIMEDQLVFKCVK